MRMRKRFLLSMLVVGLIGVTSCKDEIDEFDDHGSASIVSFTGPESVCMGDSIAFDFELQSSGQKLNQAKVQLYYGEEMVSEAFYALQADGKYSGKIVAPFLKDVADGEATVILRVQNERFAYASKSMIVAVSRPKADFLNLVTADGQTFKMMPTGNDYEYSVTSNFPLEMDANIVMPANAATEYTTGNNLEFGMADGKILLNSPTMIGFESTSYNEDGKYTIIFNTKTFEGTPFPKFGIRFDNQNDFIEFSGSGNTFTVEADFVKDQIIKVSGIKADYPDYWKNPTWFDVVQEDDKLLHFRGRPGKYTITLDKGLKGIFVEQAENRTTSEKLNATAMWVIGAVGIGFPTYALNAINWGTSRALNLVPLEENKYQLILLGGGSINVDNVNFKFYGSKTSWSPEWKFSQYNIQEGADFIKANSVNDGNFIEGSKSWSKDKFYLFTVDTSVYPSLLWVEEKDELPLYSIGE